MNYLNENIQKALRAAGSISLNEVVAKQGDLFIAVNVISGDKRVIQIDKNVVETIQTNCANNKKLLKG